MNRTLVLFFVNLLSIISSSFARQINIVNPVEVINKVFFTPQVSVSKLPPFFEFFLQKIQSQFSTYAHEDLSRPPTWDRPVYTLSPEDQIIFSANTTDITVNSGSTTEKLFEIIKNGVTPNISIEVIQDTTGSSLTNENFDKLFEVINSVTGVKNDTFIYITPRPLGGASEAHIKPDKVVDADLELDISIKETARTA